MEPAQWGVLAGGGVKGKEGREGREEREGSYKGITRTPHHITIRGYHKDYRTADLSTGETCQQKRLFKRRDLLIAETCQEKRLVNSRD